MNGCQKIPNEQNLFPDLNLQTKPVLCVRLFALKDIAALPQGKKEKIKMMSLVGAAWRRWGEKRTEHGNSAGVYNTIVHPNLFQPKWWHFIYKIPRKW